MVSESQNKAKLFITAIYKYRIIPNCLKAVRIQISHQHFTD